MERGEEYQDEFGASEGDARENDPRLPGYTDEHDRLFRSHVQHANRLVNPGDETTHPADQLGYEAASDQRVEGRRFDELETDLANGWLSVRGAHGDWQSVRDDPREGFEHGRRLGFVGGTEMLGGTPSHQRASFADPVPDGIDPTSPESPEHTFEFQHEPNEGGGAS